MGPRATASVRAHEAGLKGMFLVLIRYWCSGYFQFMRIQGAVSVCAFFPVYVFYFNNKEKYTKCPNKVLAGEPPNHTYNHTTCGWLNGGSGQPANPSSAAFSWLSPEVEFTFPSHHPKLFPIDQRTTRFHENSSHTPGCEESNPQLLFPWLHLHRSTRFSKIQKAAEQNSVSLSSEAFVLAFPWFAWFFQGSRWAYMCL